MNEKNIFNGGLQLNHCRADNDNCEIIMPDGYIAKCDHCLNGPYIGHINSKERDNELIAQWKREQPEFAECAACPLYPSCIRIAGCAWLKDGCNELSRKFRIEKKRKDILELYNNWLKESCKN